MSQFNATLKVTISPTISTSIYAANDVIGGLLTFTLQSPRGGVLRSLRIVDDDNEKAAIDFHFFDALPATISDNNAFSLAVADLKKYVGRVQVGTSDYLTIGSDAVAIKAELALELPVSSSALYAYAVATGTPTYTAATDLTFSLYYWPNET